MATESHSGGRYVRPPQDNTRLITDLTVIIKAVIGMMETCSRAGITLDVPETSFSSKVEQRRVRGTRLSDVVHGRVAVGHTNGMHPDYRPDVPCWTVSIYTRADAPVNDLMLSGKGADTERQLERHPELAEALQARTMQNNGTHIVLYIPTGE